MRVSTTPDVVRIMGSWVRRADAGLARSAARNAATSLADYEAGELDTVRTMRDLHALEASMQPGNRPRRSGARP